MKHNLLQLVLACVLTLAGTNNGWAAPHTGPYVGAFGGGDLLLAARSNDYQGTFKLRFDPSFYGGLTLGWDVKTGSQLGEGRIELEYAHRTSPLVRTKFIEGGDTGSGDVTADSLLVNCFGVYHDNTWWSPYVGGGIGVARMEAVNLKVAGKHLSDDMTTVFAYQLGAGVEVPVTGWLTLDLGYRFFGSIRPRFSEGNGHSFKMDYYNHGVQLGFRAGF